MVEEAVERSAESDAITVGVDHIEFTRNVHTGLWRCSACGCAVFLRGKGDHRRFHATLATRPTQTAADPDQS